MARKLWFRIPLFVVAIHLTACVERDQEIDTSLDMSDATDDQVGSPGDNPFFVASPLYFGYPPFDRVEDGHYLPAFEAGMEQQLAELEGIVNQEAAPTVQNTLVPLERSGQLLTRVSNVFFAMVSAHTNDTIDDIETDIAPRLAAHRDEILLDSEFFAYIKDDGQTVYLV